MLHTHTLPLPSAALSCVSLKIFVKRKQAGNFTVNKDSTKSVLQHAVRHERYKHFGHSRSSFTPSVIRLSFGMYFPAFRKAVVPYKGANILRKFERPPAHHRSRSDVDERRTVCQHRTRQHFDLSAAPVGYVSVRTVGSCLNEGPQLQLP